jgi:transposase-like protein
MDRELRDLQRALARVRRRSGPRRYSAELRSQVTAWVAKRREAGDWWCDVSRALGIPADTLARWATRRDSATMMPVEVDVPPAGTVTLVAPSGLRIEGVAVADAIAILQALA